MVLWYQNYNALFHLLNIHMKEEQLETFNSVPMDPKVC